MDRTAATLCWLALQATADTVPQFYFPGGKPVSAEVRTAALEKIDELFRSNPDGLAIPAARELVKEVSCIIVLKVLNLCQSSLSSSGPNVCHWMSACPVCSQYEHSYMALCLVFQQVLVCKLWRIQEGCHDFVHAATHKSIAASHVVFAKLSARFPKHMLCMFRSFSYQKPWRILCSTSLLRPTAPQSQEMPSLAGLRRRTSYRYAGTILI